MKKETFYIPKQFVSALINDDRSGLTEEEDTALDNFIQWGLSGYSRFYAVCPDSEHWDVHFSGYNDVLEGVACDCIAMEFVIE